MPKQFDITTSAGVRKSADYLEKHRSTNVIATKLKQGLDLFDKYGWCSPFIGYWAIWKVGQGTWNLVKKMTDVEDTIVCQKEVVLAIIRAGAEENVDEIEVTIDSKTGLSLGSTVEGFPVEVVAGKSGKLTLKVKYK